MSEFIGRNPEQPFELAQSIIVIAGPNLSGKTRLSDELAQHLDISLLDIDQGWRERWGTLENRPPMPEVYAHNHDRARPILAEGKPVVLVATYSWPTYHEMLEQLAKETNSPLRVFILGIPEDKADEEIKRRLAMRLGDPNNISDIVSEEKVWESRNKYRVMQQPDDPTMKVTVIDSTIDPTENVKFILSSLSDLRKY